MREREREIVRKHYTRLRVVVPPYNDNEDHYGGCGHQR